MAGQPATIDVTIADPSRPAGERTVAYATVRDADGVQVPGASVLWGGGNGTVAQINEVTGVITAFTPGTVTITARHGELTGSAVFTVVAPVTPVKPTRLDYDLTTLRIGAPFGALSLDYDQDTLVLDGSAANALTLEYEQTTLILGVAIE